MRYYTPVLFTMSAINGGDLEEGHRGSSVQSAVFDHVLLGEIFGRFDRRPHAFHREEGGQVGRVRGD